VNWSSWNDIAVSRILNLEAIGTNSVRARNHEARRSGRLSSLLYFNNASEGRYTTSSGTRMREYRYLRSELLAWLMGTPNTGSEAVSTDQTQPIGHHLEPVVDISSKRVYHRNPRYR
jgi:hypothetical protein